MTSGLIVRRKAYPPIRRRVGNPGVLLLERVKPYLFPSSVLVGQLLEVGQPAGLVLDVDLLHEPPPPLTSAIGGLRAWLPWSWPVPGDVTVLVRAG